MKHLTDLFRSNNPKAIDQYADVPAISRSSSLAYLFNPTRAARSPPPSINTWVTGVTGSPVLTPGEGRIACGRSLEPEPFHAAEGDGGWCPETYAVAW